MNIWILGIILLEIYDQIMDEMKKDDYKNGCRIGELELLMPLIKQLLALDLDKRLDSTEALNAYEKWLKNLTKQSSPRGSPETFSVKPGTKFLTLFPTPSPTPSPSQSRYVSPRQSLLETGGSLYKKTRRYKLKKGKNLTKRKKHNKTKRKKKLIKRSTKHIYLRKL